jgi:predicted component of type VI protein secretion system
MLFWLSILPSFHFWAGNAALVARAMSNVFGFEFEINENSKTSYDIPDQLQYRLGAKTGRLGYESILGNSFSELDSGYDIIIKNVNYRDVKGLLPGGKTREKIEWLLNICMPNNLVYDIKIKTKKDSREKPEDISGQNYLGYSSFI